MTYGTDDPPLVDLKDAHKDDEMVENPEWTVETLREEIRGLSAQLEIATQQEQRAWRERDEMIKLRLDTERALKAAVVLLAYFGGRA